MYEFTRIKKFEALNMYCISMTEDNVTHILLLYL